MLRSSIHILRRSILAYFYYTYSGWLVRRSLDNSRRVTDSLGEILDALPLLSERAFFDDCHLKYFFAS